MEDNNKKPQILDTNQPSNINFQRVNEDLKSEQESNIQLEKIQKKIRKNKYVFYGLPLTIIVLIFIALLGFLLPAYVSYRSYSANSKVLDENLISAKKSASNLSSVLKKEESIDKFSRLLQQDIPENSELSNLISTVQQNANDNGLKWNFTKTENVQNLQNTNSSIIGVAQNPNQSLFKSLNTGEVEFTPKYLGNNASAKLISIELSIQGTKDNFYKFMNSIKSLKPKVILSSIEYKERLNNQNVRTVDVKLRLESYSLKLNQADPKTPVQISVDSDSLITPINEETFNINSEIVKEFENS